MLVTGLEVLVIILENFGEAEIGRWWEGLLGNRLMLFDPLLSLRFAAPWALLYRLYPRDAQASFGVGERWGPGVAFHCECVCSGWKRGCAKYVRVLYQVLNVWVFDRKIKRAFLYLPLLIAGWSLIHACFEGMVLSKRRQWVVRWCRPCRCCLCRCCWRCCRCRCSMLRSRLPLLLFDDSVYLLTL